MFDAYTVKKVLPRLAIAVILIQLSWFITTGAIFITNQIAFGIEGLMYGAFGGSANFGLDSLLAGSSSSSATTLGTTLLFATVGVAFGGGVLAIAAFVVIAVVVAFLSLAVRRALLILLVLLSPIALVAWILPNTERFWKMWWDNFTKLLLMFPLIMAMIAAGRIFAFIAGKDPNGDIVKTTIVLAGFFVPLLLIPKTFTLAGSAFAAMGGAIAQRGAGAQNWAQGMGKNRQKKKWANRGQQALAGKAFKNASEGSLRGRANRRIQQAAHLNKAGLKPWAMRENIASAIQTTNKQQRDKMKEDADYATWMNNDDLNRAAAESNNATELRQILRNSGNYVGRERALEEDVARVERVRKKFGNDAFRQRAVLQAIAGGTAYGTGAEAWQAVGRVAGNDRAALADLVAEGRSAAMSAGRVDMGGAGFGATMQLVDNMMDDPVTHNIVAANAQLSQSVLDSQGAGVLAHSSMKPAAIDNLAPALRQRATDAIGAAQRLLTDPAATPEQRAAAQSEIDSQFANIANVYDQLSGTSPQLADRFADQVMSQELDVGHMSPELRGMFGSALTTTDPATGAPMSRLTGTISLRQALEARRGSPDFLNKRRELTREESASHGPAPGPGGPATTPPTTPGT